jgi:hypothetical protein
MSETKFDYHKVLEIMQGYGYSENCTRSDGEDDFVSVIASKRTPSDNLIACEFYATGEFRFSYFVPDSINRLSADKCGSVQNEEHFTRLEKKFMQHADILALHAAG